MVTTAASAPRRLYRPANILRDYAYVLPGFALSLVAFALLVPLTVLSVGTLIIWIGAILLPMTLLVASGFAALSRARLRHWGVDLPPVRYAGIRPGFSGYLRRMADSRRWLDLAFETIVAFPLRIVTFVLAVTWSVGALAGVSYPAWGYLVPRDDMPTAGIILTALTGGDAPTSLTHSFLLDAGFTFVIGCAFLVTLPPVLRGLAHMDAAATAAALGGDRQPTRPAGTDGTTLPLDGETPLGNDTPLDGITPRGADTRDTDPAPVSPTGEGWAWIVAIAVSVVSIAVGWPVLSAVYAVPVAIAMLIAAAHAAALLLTVRHPGIGITVQTLAAVCSAAAASGAVGPPWPWPVMTIILQAFLVLIVALRTSWPWGVAAWAAPQAAVLLASVIFRLDVGARTNMIVSASITLGLLVVALIVAQLVLSREALQAERRTSADLSAHSRELDARNRIAQELHDVVAHSMSVISVQATTARYRLSDLDVETEREFDSIAESSRQALAEMRSLLAILRAPDEGRDAPLAPQPSLADIPALVEATRRSGAEVTLTQTPTDAPFTTNAPATTSTPATTNTSVPSSTALSAYRIVQEALSNAVRHSPGAPVDVTVTRGADALTLTIDNGPADEGHRHPAAPGAGLGLTGVRERVDALGGSVEAGARSDGGFRLRAVLPLR